MSMTGYSGSSTVLLSNPSAVTVNSDGNTVTVIRSDNNTQITVNVGTATANADVQAALDLVAVELAGQNAVLQVLVQGTLNGSATGASGTTTNTLHPFSGQSNFDGLVCNYTISGAPGVLDINLGIVGTQSTSAYLAAAVAILQTAANAAAASTQAALDASSYSASGSASVSS